MAQQPRHSACFYCALAMVVLTHMVVCMLLLQEHVTDCQLLCLEVLLGVGRCITSQHSWHESNPTV